MEVVPLVRIRVKKSRGQKWLLLAIWGQKQGFFGHLGPKTGGFGIFGGGPKIRIFGNIFTSGGGSDDLPQKKRKKKGEFLHAFDPNTLALSDCNHDSF